MSESILQLPTLGVVVIGRNEGQRLRRCLASLVAPNQPVVYVDSGSTDGSVAMAKEMGVEVVELSTAGGFTAARARNAGFERLLQLSPQLALVQFVDGDCEVDSRWLASARETLEARGDVAVVCGRRRERFPQASVYNRLCDLEWDTQPGEATECGGDAMMRVCAFTAANGFNPTLIAGEEPELCVRLRLAGWKILRLDCEMTLHDAAMTRFGQWWKRNLRAGHAFAEGAAMHGKSSVRHWARQTRSNDLWGILFPLIALILAWPTRGLSIACLIALYGLIGTKIFVWQSRLRRPPRDAAAYSVFCVLGKLPQALGQMSYRKAALLGRRAALIEYKGPALSS